MRIMGFSGEHLMAVHGEVTQSGLIHSISSVTVRLTADLASVTLQSLIAGCLMRST